MGKPNENVEFTDVVPDENAGVGVIDEQPSEAVLLEEDLLIEDVSIDGMCGVY